MAILLHTACSFRKSERAIKTLVEAFENESLVALSKTLSASVFFWQTEQTEQRHSTAGPGYSLYCLKLDEVLPNEAITTSQSWLEVSRGLIRIEVANRRQTKALRRSYNTMPDFECIEIDSTNNVSVVKLKDEKVMAPARIETLGVELLSLVEDGPSEDPQKVVAKNVLINFENVRFFSSGAINKLIVLEKRLRARGGQIRLSNMQPEVRDLFSYTNLDSMFDIRNGQMEAIESFDEP